MAAYREPLALILVLMVSGCITSQIVTPRSLTPGYDYGTVRLVPFEGEPVVLEDPVVSNDSIVGRVEGQRVAFAIGDVLNVDVGGHDARKTAGLTAGVAGGTMAVGLAVGAVVAIVVVGRAAFAIVGV